MSIIEDTIEIRKGESLDWAKIEQYLREHISGIGDGSLEARQFPSGASNLTYLMRIGEWEGVLRRPPFGPIPPRAHDMQRESSLLAHIHPVFSLAPRPFVFCNDLAIMDTPFYVMERRTGFVFDETFPPELPPTIERCRQLSEATVETLVQIHAIDWQTAGLAEFGHPQNFLERQVKGWIERYFRAQTDEIPAVEPLTRWLAEHIPISPAPTLIHNDFKLNNMLIDLKDLTRPRAVLDWEMATIGDPLFDLAIALSYWLQHDDPEELQACLRTVTALPGFTSRSEFMQRYATLSGRDLSDMHFYMPFAYFKLAGILQQIYVRWKRGQTQDPRFSVFGERVHTLINYAASLI